MTGVVQVTTSSAECYGFLQKLDDEDNKLCLNENNLIAVLCSEVTTVCLFVCLCVCVVYKLCVCAYVCIQTADVPLVSCVSHTITKQYLMFVITDCHVFSCHTTAALHYVS